MARYVSLSGGADSTALAILLHERGEDFKLVFADTGAELPETYFMVSKTADILGKELIVVSNGSFYQHLVTYGFLLPSVVRRWCTRILKIKPMDSFHEESDIVAVGIRADEAHRVSGHENRRKKGSHQLSYDLITAGLGKKEVLALCRNYDLLNPAYSWRSNVSCFCCPFQRKGDWMGLLRNHPSLFALAEQWEEASRAVTEARYSWKMGRTLADMRIADEKQIKLWPEPEGEPCLICQI